MYIFFKQPLKKKKSEEMSYYRIKPNKIIYYKNIWFDSFFYHKWANDGLKRLTELPYCTLWLMLDQE